MNLLTDKKQRIVSDRILRAHRLAMSFQAAPHSSHVARDVLDAGRLTTSRKARNKWVGKVETRYHWAPILDAGRPPVRAKPGKLLVWFKDWRDDPRTKPSFSRHIGPLKRVRKLTRKEFQVSRQEGLLVMAKRVGGVPPTKFISRGGERGRLKVREEIHDWLDEQLGTEEVLLRLTRGYRVKVRSSVRLA